MASLLIEKHMLFSFVFCVSFPIILVTSVQIPFINSVILTTQNLSNNTQLMNGTCSQCLCVSRFSSSALNCFPNTTCQLFFTFPLTYQIGVATNARLYFPQQVLPNVSQSCMPNMTYLLNKLRTTNITIKNVTNPRDAVIDDNGYLVTVETNTRYLDRFDPISLNITKRILLPNWPLNIEKDVIAYFNGAYYVVAHSDPMTVVDSKNLTVIANITTTTYGIRDIIFLNNGQTLVGCSCDNNSLVFLNRTSPTSISYKFYFSQSTSFICPHGMWRVNDSFFYVTAYNSMKLYSFSATMNPKHWNESFVFTTLSGSGGAARVTIDGSGRFWFAFETDTILIYDQHGGQVGNWTIPNSAIFDITIMDNYLMYLTAAKTSQIMRVNPNIQC